MCVLLRGGFLNLSKILHEIRGNQRKLEEGADLGSMRICTAACCQHVGGVQVPSRIMHICNDERFQWQVILYTLGACELQGSSAKLSRQLHPASLLLPQEGQGT